MTTTPESVARANRVIRAFGDRSRVFFLKERRDQLDSVLFDVPRRSLLGWDGIYQHGPGFLRRLTSHATPEEIGARMRYLGRRPYQLQLAILALGYLGAREQRRLNLDLRADEPLPDEDIAATVDFILLWERIQRAYRGDGTLLPEEAAGVTHVVPDAVVDEVSDLLVPVDNAPVAAIRRATATLNSYAFLVHGEQRDGTFGHGPYSRPGGGTIFFREITDLQNGYLPWAAPGNPYPNVVIAYACQDVQVTCDTYGTLVTQPYEFTEQLTHIVALTIDSDGRPICLDEAELTSAQDGAAQGVKAMYAQMAGWESRYRLDYGRPLFANHLKTFVDLLDLGPEWGDELMRTFNSLKSDLIDRLFVEETTPSVWAHMVHGESDCFSPIVL